MEPPLKDFSGVELKILTEALEGDYTFSSTFYILEDAWIQGERVKKAEVTSDPEVIQRAVNKGPFKKG